MDNEENKFDDEEENESMKKQRELSELMEKVKSGCEEISNLDIMKFLTIVNYNFSVVGSMLKSVMTHVKLIEVALTEGTTDLNDIKDNIKKLVEDQKAFEEILNSPDESNNKT